MANGSILTPEMQRLLRQAATTCTDCRPLIDAAELLGRSVSEDRDRIAHLERMIQDVQEFDRQYRDQQRQRT